MRLANFLAATRSVKAAKDQPSPYRMKQPILLPKFGPKRASSDVDRPESIPDVSVGTADEAEVVQGEAVTQTDQRRSGFFLNFRRQGGGEKTGKDLVQPELSLERVQVVRNDLNDNSAMKDTPLGQVRGKQNARRAQSWWTRLRKRLFARDRKQD